MIEYVINHSIFEGLGTPRNGHPPELSFSLGAPPGISPNPRNFRAFGAISPYDPPDGHPPEFFSASGHPPEIREFRGVTPRTKMLWCPQKVLWSPQDNRTPDRICGTF